MFYVVTLQDIPFINYNKTENLYQIKFSNNYELLWLIKDIFYSVVKPSVASFSPPPANRVTPNRVVKLDHWPMLHCSNFSSFN